MGIPRLSPCKPSIMPLSLRLFAPLTTQKSIDGCLGDGLTSFIRAGEAGGQLMVTAASKYVLSYGGGVNTVALMILLVRENMPFDEVVFADTGGEVPETYDYLSITREFLEQHGVPFRIVTARENEDLYGCSFRRRVIPSAVWRWSTRDFKVRPIHRYYRTLGVHINQYMGIAYDEVDRMKDSQVEYVTNHYPLIENRVTRQGCIDIIKAEGLPVPVKSGCFFCPFSSLDRWRWLYETHPELYSRAVDLEENSKHFPDQRLTDQVFRKRATVTLRELAARFEAHLDSELLPDPTGNVCGGECMT